MSISDLSLLFHITQQQQRWFKYSFPSCEVHILTNQTAYFRSNIINKYVNLEIKYINLGTNISMVKQMLLFMKPFIVFYFFRFGRGSSETTYHLELSPLCRPATLPLTTGAMFRCTARVRSLYPKAWTVGLSLKRPLSL